MSEIQNNNEHTDYKSSIELRSDEVQEIMSHPPGWMVRWGITLIFVLLLLFIFLSWLIKYPDVIKGTTTLTTAEPPIKLVAKSAGEIELLQYKENSVLQQGQVIATIKSTLSDSARDFLTLELSKIKKAYQNNSLEKLQLRSTTLVFGDVQPNVSALTTALKNYQFLINEDNTAFNIANTSKQINNQKALQQLIAKQLNSSHKLLNNAESKFRSDKTLFEKGVISQTDFFERERTHETTINEINNLEKNKISTAISITDLEKQLNDLKFTFEQKRKSLLIEIETQLSTIENSLQTWTRTYQLTAPINGKLSYLQILSENQFIESGKALFAIIPSNQSYIAQLKIPKSGYGKVKKGQKVMLKIDNFPAHEYGQLIGKVKSISLIANEENYLVKVELTNGLKTTYNKELNYTPEMSGTAEIITEDLRITDRIFNQFRKIFDR
ncbi:MAG: HlyD family secretion protein [Brumimicrobium sp.]|nr:HlyD family secretion protein [Brumimicrobium sp.]